MNSTGQRIVAQVINGAAKTNHLCRRRRCQHLQQQQTFLNLFRTFTASSLSRQQQEGTNKSKHQAKILSSSLRHNRLFTSSAARYNGAESQDDTGERKDFSALLLKTNIVDAKHVAHLELNKPKTKNAFGFESAQQLADALRMLENNPRVRCLVVSGNGDHFTSGVDLKSFMTVYGQLQAHEDPAHRAKLLRKTVERFQAPFKAMHAFQKPIIGVAHGLCYGLGMELAACCDIRYCSQDTQFSIREVLIGIAADVGSLQLMPRLTANQSLLRELIYTGRNLTMAEVKELGFVSKILPTKEEALEAAMGTARTIASRSPLAIQGTKQNLTFSEDKPFAVGLDYNAIWNMAMMQGNDVEKAITAILSRSDQVDYEDF